MPRLTISLAFAVPLAACLEYQRPPAAGDGGAPDLTHTFPTGCSSGAKDGDETDVDCEVA